MSLLRNRSLFAATLGHFSVDMYSGMLPLVLLVLTDQLKLSYSQVGLISMIFSLSSSLSQPFFGWIGDRRGKRPMAVLGVAAIAITVGLMRFVDNYLTLSALAIIAGLGSGAFHPQGAVLAAQTPLHQRGSAASIFMMGGNTGYAFGPLFGTAAFALAGIYLPEMLGLLGLAQAALVYWALSIQRYSKEIASQVSSSITTQTAALGIVIPLSIVIFLRSWVSSSVSTFVPQVYKAQGFSITEASSVLFSILLPLAIGGLIGGTLSDKIGRRRVLIVSTALIGPTLWGLMHAAGSLSFILGPLLGLAMGASVPVTLVMAQSLIPRGLGFMSGIVLGFTFIAGAVGVAINGIIADQIGLITMMTFNAVLPLAAAALSFLLPDDSPRLTATVSVETLNLD